MTTPRGQPDRRGGATVLLAFLLVLAAPLGAQQPDLERLRGAMPPGEGDRLERVVREAGGEGVPTEPLLNKVAEGLAKGVPADRVVAAVADYARRLGEAARLVGETADPPAVVAGADALRRGVAPEAIRSVAREAGARTPVALVVLGDLGEMGVPSGNAVEMVRTALRRGRGGEGLLGLSASVRGLVRQGTPPGLAASAVTRALNGRGPPAGVPPVNLPPAARGGGPPVPPGVGPPGRGRGPPAEPGPPGGERPPGGGPPGGGPPGGGGASGGDASAGGP